MGVGLRMDTLPSSVILGAQRHQTWKPGEAPLPQEICCMSVVSLAEGEAERREPGSQTLILSLENPIMLSSSIIQAETDFQKATK